MTNEWTKTPTEKGAYWVMREGGTLPILCAIDASFDGVLHVYHPGDDDSLPLHLFDEHRFIKIDPPEVTW